MSGEIIETEVAKEPNLLKDLSEVQGRMLAVLEQLLEEVRELKHHLRLINEVDLDEMEED